MPEEKTHGDLIQGYSEVLEAHNASSYSVSFEKHSKGINVSVKANEATAQGSLASAKELTLKALQIAKEIEKECGLSQ